MLRKLIWIVVIAGLGYAAYRGWRSVHFPQKPAVVSVPQPPSPPPLPVAPPPRAAIVIDDVAYDLATMDRYAALKMPLTFAILPGGKHARSFSDKAHDLGFPVIIHLPLEPLDRVHNDPGPAGLYLAMTEEQRRRQFDKDLASVSHIEGLNNHMGSAFTENEDAMTHLLTWVKARGLFFLDSRTSLHTVGPHVARRLHLPYLVNQTFLDNADDTEAIEKQLDIVMKLALRRKMTVAIGHYRRKHLAEALAAKLPQFRAKGIQLVGLPDLLKK